MPDNETRRVLKNIDQRLERVEQILPTLATKDELKPLATKDELNAAVAKLATKEELEAAVAKLATKEELAAAIAPLATKEELREEGERSRRYMKILTEEIKDKVDMFAERLVTLDQRDAYQHAETIKRHVALERRVTALEVKRPRRRG